MDTKLPNRDPNFRILLRSDENRIENKDINLLEENKLNDDSASDESSDNQLILPYDDDEMESRYQNFLAISGITKEHFSQVDVESSSYSSSNNDDDSIVSSEELNQLRKRFENAYNEGESLRSKKISRINEQNSNVRSKSCSGNKSKGRFSQSSKKQEKCRKNVKETKSNQATRKFVCRYKDCRKVLKTSSTLRKHQLMHSDMSRQYSCLICTIRCLSKSSTRAHYTINHSGGVNDPERRIIACKACKKRFNSNNALMEHKKRTSHN